MHRFETTQDAYTATQCGATYDEQGNETPVCNGETLVIESEGVVGICDTWPVAVTAAPGDLHAVGDWGAMLARKGITLDCIRLAAARAEQMGYPLAPALVAFLDAQRATELAKEAKRRAALEFESAFAALVASAYLSERIYSLRMDEGNRLRGQCAHAAGNLAAVADRCFKAAKRNDLRR